MKLIDNELGGTTPMDIIINLMIRREVDEEYDDLLEARLNQQNLIGSQQRK